MNRFELEVGRWYWVPSLGLIKLREPVSHMGDAEVINLEGVQLTVMPGSMRQIEPRVVDRQEVRARARDGWQETDAALFWRVRRDNGFGSDVFKEPA